VLALEAVVQLEALLDDVEPPRLRLERVRVAAEIRAELLGLQPERCETLRQRAELGIGSRDRLREALGVGEQRRDAGSASDAAPGRAEALAVAARRNRLRARSRRLQQPVQLAQPRALGRERVLLLGGRPERLDLLDLEGEQVQVAVAGACALAQLGQVPIEGAHARVGGGERRAQVQVLAPAEAVEQVELCRRQRQLAVLVLAEEGDQPAAERRQVRRRGGPALDEGARPTARRDPAGEHYFVEIVLDPLAQLRELGIVQEPVGQLEYAFNVRLRRARAHDPGLRLSAEEQVQRVRQHRLPGPRLARDRGQPVARPQLGPLDQEQVLYAQLEQHPAGVPAPPDGERVL
jgi:hypothetical protein